MTFFRNHVTTDSYFVIEAARCQGIVAVQKGEKQVCDDCKDFNYQADERIRTFDSTKCLEEECIILKWWTDEEDKRGNRMEIKSKCFCQVREIKELTEKLDNY